MGKLSARIIDELGLLENLSRNSALSQTLRSRGVVRCSELLRVRDLPRRVLLGLEDSDEGDTLARVVSDLLYWAAGGKGPSPLPLRPMQAAMLVDATEHQGLTASLDVGQGKSWVAALLVCEPGSVPQELLDACGGKWPQIECERPVMLLPPSVKDEMESDVLPTLRQHYKIHPNLQLISYSTLQTVKGADALQRARPDVIIADEVNNLKNLTSARSKRVKHWMKVHPQTVFCGFTATLSDTSPKDYHHIVLWSHPNDPPLPRGWKTLNDWASALDADTPDFERLAPGALLELCEPGESAREGFQRRLAETHGFILATEPSIDIPITLTARRDVTLPQNVLDAINALDEAWVTPDGEPVPDAARLAQHMRTLSLGFYYVWDWSKCTHDGKPDLLWLEARKDWVDVVRDICRRGNPELDSELRVRNATRAGNLPRTIVEEARAALSRWDVESKKKEPETKPIWLSDIVMKWALLWAREHVGIVWCEHTAVLDWFEQRLDAKTFFPGGANEPLRQLARGPRAGEFSIVVSRASHFQGKNLQAWHENLVLTPSPNGKIWQQKLGRTHRAKQKHHEVTCDFLAHTEVSFRSMTSAVKRARYTHETLKSPQKLLDCVAVGWSRE